MSWKPAVQVFGEEPFYTNGLTFASEREAMDSAEALSNRWFLVRDFRAEEVDTAENPVNYKRENGKDVAL
jgi:hypothetical protein